MGRINTIIRMPDDMQDMVKSQIKQNRTLTEIVTDLATHSHHISRSALHRFKVGYLANIKRKGPTRNKIDQHTPSPEFRQLLEDLGYAVMLKEMALDALKPTTGTED